MNQGTVAVIAVSAVLVLWYLAGRLYNRRRGEDLRRWLVKGLSPLGGEREMGWIGSPASGARINVTRAQSPFRRLEVTLLLANREIPLLWLLDCLRGRRDRVIVRGTLRSPRRGEVRVGSSQLGSDQQGGWTHRQAPHGLHVAYRGHEARRMVVQLEPWLEAYGAHLSQLDWRQKDPHVSLQLRIAGLRGGIAERFLADLAAGLEPRGQD